jgi:integrase
MGALTTGENTMPRPRKARYFCGVLLAEWLYPDPRNREGQWRYRRPDGTFKYFHASSVEKANKIAEANNDKRDTPRDSLSQALDLYIAYRERQDANIVGKASWRNRKYALAGFGCSFNAPVSRITRDQIKSYWDGLTYHQQKARFAEFRRLWNWLMGEGLSPLPYNPFTLSDERPRLYASGVPEKARARLSRDDFWAIYAAAGELGYQGLQIAMGLSLTTFMREGDICSLKLSENLESNLLQLVVGKSLAQRGSSQAARLQWDVGSHQLVRSLLLNSRELSMKNSRCPFVISHKPLAIRPSKTKEHSCQILPRRLIAMFAEARKAAGVSSATGADPTFHEIRSLASKLAADAGYNLKDVQADMAHESDGTTKGYMSGHQLPFEPARVIFTEEMCGGVF